MPEINRDGDAFASGLAALLPTGIAWPRESDTVLMGLVRALAEEWARVDKRGADLLGRESDPRATIELLDAWETAFGLPDPCVAEPQTIEARQQVLVNRMTMEGSQSRAFFIQIAADLGYEIEIKEYSPFMCGVSEVGETLHGWEIGPAEIRFYWSIAIAGARLSWFRAGSGQAGVDHLLEIGIATDITCIFNRLKPAHTQVLFDYSESL
ncbi:DUF2313 domain-containing protein [Kaistia dalseonensis]|uniref:Uncharacterized protein YmfQ (DUF2313 family) n=1 Tax=Kaistia dalseonensis TaxID=410840 RepID=A0ABU0HB98_9HYPH|nr:putative phage tail protein [Kaistia dalseonensis]MCX5496425.1 DUF2313 domain-containing protein [Kaistia dalseonensis]MDQ0439045.1 uncharacterized protein YmfQ (DUF2313 family) [Kaistia dalseonensis]